MSAPPLPDNEAERLQALYSSRLLHTVSEPTLERIVRRAVALLEAPIGAVSLVDEKMQYFKGVVGLGVPYSAREVSFCAYAMLHRKVFVVPDAAKDPRFLDNALVQGPPYIRFYAGAPVFGSTGYPFGAFCVMDTRPRNELKDEHLLALIAMAAEVSTELARQTHSLMMPQPNEAAL